MLCEIKIIAYDYDFKRNSYTNLVFGKEFAKHIASDYAEAINVLEVIVTDNSTGEVLVSYEHGKLTWEA